MKQFFTYTCTLNTPLKNFAGCMDQGDLLLNLLRRALGWAFRLPVIRWADVLGGALLGAVECAVVLWIVCAVAGLFDGGRLRALAEGTHLLSIFA